MNGRRKTEKQGDAREKRRRIMKNRSDEVNYCVVRSSTIYF